MFKLVEVIDMDHHLFKLIVEQDKVSKLIVIDMRKEGKQLYLSKPAHMRFDKWAEITKLLRVALNCYKNVNPVQNLIGTNSMYQSDDNIFTIQDEQSEKEKRRLFLLDLQDAM